MTTGIDPRDFGRLEAEVAALKKTVDAMAASAGLTPSQVDDLFRAAAIL